MFKHISLASSSAGNSHLVSQDGGSTYIMLDCGLSKKDLFRKLLEVKININQIKALFVTHEHQDHIRGLSYLIDYMPCYGSKGTMELYQDDINCKIMKVNKVYVINGFKIMGIESKHDAKEPFNFIIQNEIEEYMLYLTDTGMVNFNLKGIRFRYILIEANYDEEELNKRLEEDTTGYLKTHLRRNLMLDNGHLSLKKTHKILEQLSLGMCKGITLCHLSPRFSKSDFAIRTEKVFKIPTKQLKAKELETTEIKEKIEYGF